MKYFLLSSLLFPLFLFAQLRGKFCFQTRYETETICFDENQVFRYELNSCMGTTSADGTFELRDNILILNFSGDRMRLSPEKPVADSSYSDSDSVSLNIIVTDHLSQAPARNLLVYPDNGENEIPGFGMTNFAGNCKLMVPKKQETSALYIIGPNGFLLDEYMINPGFNYKLIFHSQLWNDPALLSGKRLIFETECICDDNICLREFGAKSGFRAFERSTKDK